jgi:DNA repair protein RadC
MSDVNSTELDLYVRDTSSFRAATFEETLHAARRALAQRFRPGRSLRSPELVQEYLRFALASKEYEVFCLILERYPKLVRSCSPKIVHLESAGIGPRYG